ncbi:hypothetical protein [Streptomyces sp. NPDC057682]|uniref:hypothetical protein n=1 Tax=Streptomyces sp. NPDC057682 TaxID=3346210 RepID=UPI0036C2D3FA
MSGAGDERRVRVVYRRVGARGGSNGSTPPEPLEVSVGRSASEDVARAVARDVRPYLLSPVYRVVIEEGGRSGYVLCGVRTGGEFVIENFA